MNLNATLIAQFVVFFILAWFTMTFVWPPLMKALDDRAKKIADGLAAADKGKEAMAVAEKRAQAELSTARDEGQKRISDAEKRALGIIEEAKKITELSNIVTQSKEEMLKNIDDMPNRIKYGNAIIDLGEYVSSISPKKADFKTNLLNLPKSAMPLARHIRSAIWAGHTPPKRLFLHDG